jgi:hypothetical protein
MIFEETKLKGAFVIRYLNISYHRKIRYQHPHTPKPNGTAGIAENNHNQFLI